MKMDTKELHKRLKDLYKQAGVTKVLAYLVVEDQGMLEVDYGYNSVEKIGFLAVLKEREMMRALMAEEREMQKAMGRDGGAH